MKDKDSIPEKLTLQWIENNAHVRLVGNGLRWIITAWRNIIFLKISEDWTPEEMDGYVNRLSALPAILSKQWEKIFLVFDLSQMKFKKEDAFRYLRSNWVEFLDHDDLRVCIVEESKMRLLLLRSLYRFIGKLDRVELFSDCNEAFGWVREEIISYKSITNE